MNEKNQIMKSVCVGMSIDIFHHGHINIIEQASKYGELTIDLQMRL